MNAILITRSIDHLPKTIHWFERQGNVCYSHPLTKIIYFPVLKLLYQPQVVVVTSQHAALSLKKLDLPKSTPLFTVGRTSALVLTRQGFFNVAMVKERVEALNTFISHQPLHAYHNILYVRGVDITAPLYHPSAQIKSLISYQAQLQWQIPGDILVALREGHITKVAFFSKRIARHFEALAQLYDISLHCLTAACLSNDIAAVLHQQWLKIKILDHWLEPLDKE